MDGNSDVPEDLQHVGATDSVLGHNHTTLCAVSKLRLHTILTHTIRLLLVALQIILRQCQRAGMLCVRQLHLRCSHILDDCFDHVNLPPTLFSETVSMESVQTSRAECALGLDRLKCFRTSLGHTQPSFSRSTHRV